MLLYRVCRLTTPSSEFEIRDVFNDLYRGACRALSDATNFPSHELIWRHMSVLHATFRRSGKPITSLHQETMERHRETWSRVEGSVDTCYGCLRRRPEYALPCGHVVCLSCVKDFGVQCRQNPYRFVVTCCFLCGAECNLVVLDRPPTAGVGLLCLDGGGIRGIMQTEILCFLEERIGLPIPIQEHFQLVAGVSAGAYIGQAGHSHREIVPVSNVKQAA